MSIKQKDCNNLIEATISMLETKQHFYKKSFCIACGVEFRATLIPICSDCLDNECDAYIEKIEDNEAE